MNKKLNKAVILLAWLILWQITAFFVNNHIYFASPLEVLLEIVSKAADRGFWLSICGSLLRITTGFIISGSLAFIMAFASFRFKCLRDFLSPAVTFFKSVPIAAVVVVLLIWWGPRYLVLCISMMVVFPNVYLNMLTGISNADRSLIEMSDVFKTRRIDRFLWIYRPAYLPYLHSAVSVSLGMCFKSGIAAEVIGLPEFSIGEQLYRDKIYLNTAGVFAWIVVVLILSSVTERLIGVLLKRLSNVPSCIDLTERENHGRKYETENRKMTPYSVIADRIIKKYDDRVVIDTDLKLIPGQIYSIKAPSGSGKTTLLKILSGILKPDSGTVQTGSISMVFQDDRLIPNANGLRNLRYTLCSGNLREEYLKLLPADTLGLPASSLSGGERRRLCILRAMLRHSQIVIMDEPFAGLDEATKQYTADWILKNLNGRTLIYTAHDPDPVIWPGSEEIKLIDKKRPVKGE